MQRISLLGLFGALMALSLILGACGGGTPEVVYVTETVFVTVEVTVEVPVEVPVMVPSDAAKALVVCQAEEPETLYLYSGNVSLAARHIQQAVYDGPIDNRTYTYQPVILEKLPNLDDGDAVINTVTVQAGDKVVNAADEVVDLEVGMLIRPAGCNAAECALEFDGTPVQMQQMMATFRIVNGVKWSDGTPLTADDSVYGYELNGDPDTPIPHFPNDYAADLSRDWGMLLDRHTYDRTASYEALNEQTTVWVGLPGYIDQQYFTNFWHPFPRHLWQEQLGYRAADLMEAQESARLPMGWGPFVIQEWVSGDHITVVRNPHYFRADEGLPYIETVIFRFVSDSNAVVAELISGECDVATHDVGLEEQADLLLKLEQQNILQPVFMTTQAWEHVDFGIQPAATDARPNFFGDARVRQAIALCLDRQRVVDTVLYGRTGVAHSYIPPEHPLYAGERLTEYSYDPAAGRALLEEVGWLDLGEDMLVAQDIEGVPNGTRFEFRWSSSADARQMAYMQIFQRNLAECGIKVVVDNVPAAEWLAAGPEGPLFGRRFDMGAWSRLTGVAPPCDFYTDFGGANIPSADNEWFGQNVAGFSHAGYDAACSRAHTAFPGSADYREGHLEAQRLFSAQLPAIPLFQHIKLAAARPGVSGFIADPTEDSEMWNIEALNFNF